MTTNCKAYHSASDEVIQGKPNGVSSGAAHCALVFTQPGNYHVETFVFQIESGELIAHVDTDVISRYVRRDIRKLNAADLNAVMEAMHIVYTLSKEEGVATYGEEYKSIGHFVTLHLSNSIPDKQRKQTYVYFSFSIYSQSLSLYI